MACHQARRETLESMEVWEVVRSVFFSCCIVLVSLYLLKIIEFPRIIFFFIGINLAIFLSLWRVAKHFSVEYFAAKGYHNFNVLIIGAGKVGMALTNEIKKRPGFGLKISGYLDDFKQSDDAVKVLGTLAEFKRVARHEFINKIFITIHHDTRVFQRIIEEAKELGIAVRVIPQSFDLSSGEIYRYNIGYIPILEYCDQTYGIRQTGKRLFDFSMSSFLVVACLPIFILLFILIKLDSPGPVFYKSRRYGRGGKIFYMIKFRSMRLHADSELDQLKEKNEVDGPIFKIKGDPRITRMGQFLRKYSLDELPQIFNVFNGSMSLVGPRPLPIEQIEKADFRQLKRLEVRPGMTGLWQVRILLLQH